MKRKAIIVDIDGTLADVSGRIHHLEQKIKNWHKFHSCSIDDKVNAWCLEIIWAFHEKDFSIILLTGRDDQYLDITLAWLKKNKIPYDKLHMRSSDDTREDSVMKKDVYLNQIKNEFDVLFIIEDRLSVVSMWRHDLHLPCLQCDWGEF